MTTIRVLPFEDAQALAGAAAGLISDAIASRADSGAHRFTLGLAGGSTPAATYGRLAGMDGIGWDRVDAWLSDERWVPPEHEDSNGRMAADLLMDHVPARFLRPRWASWMEAGDSAAHYEADLRSIHPDGRADLVLLGLGDDGHTASLFPGTAALDAPAHRWFVANDVPQLGVERLTTTYRFLRQAHHVVFLVAGAAKAPALRQVLEPGEDEPFLPAAGVMGGEAAVTWMLDAAAAAELSQATLTRE